MILDKKTSMLMEEIPSLKFEMNSSPSSTLEKNSTICNLSNIKETESIYSSNPLNDISMEFQKKLDKKKDDSNKNPSDLVISKLINQNSVKNEKENKKNE